MVTTKFDGWAMGGYGASENKTEVQRNGADNIGSLIYTTMTIKNICLQIISMRAPARSDLDCGHIHIRPNFSISTNYIFLKNN